MMDDNTVTQSHEFSQEPTAVWAIATNLNRREEWFAGHAAFPDGVPALKPGASFREQVLLMGIPGAATWTVQTLNAPSLWSITGDGPMETHLGQRLELSAVDGGTLVTFTTRFGGAMVGPLVGKLVDAMGTASGQSLQRLQELVHAAEAGGH